MSKEVPCMFDPTKACNCRWYVLNEQDLIAYAKRRYIKGIFNREGFDQVTFDLFSSLMHEPNRVQFSDALQSYIKFSKQLLALRATIGKERFLFLLREEKPKDVYCDQLREHVQISGKDATAFLQLLKEKFT